MSYHQGSALIRSSATIQEGLLQNAFARAEKGEVGRSPSEISQLITIFLHRAREMPTEHSKALNAIDPREPRAVLQLNRLAQEVGWNQRYTAQAANISAPVAVFDLHQIMLQPSN